METQIEYGDKLSADNHILSDCPQLYGSPEATYREFPLPKDDVIYGVATANKLSGEKKIHEENIERKLSGNLPGCN